MCLKIYFGLFGKPTVTFHYFSCIFILQVRSKKANLLEHPLPASLLNHKWRSFGFHSYILNLTFYIFFVCVFNAYMLTAVPPYLIGKMIDLTRTSYLTFIFIDCKATGSWSIQITTSLGEWGLILLKVRHRLFLLDQLRLTAVKSS